MGLSDKAKELVEAIKNTGEFVELKKARSIVENNTILKDKVVQFNKTQMELYSNKISMKEAEVKRAELDKMLNNMSGIPEINRFLKAVKMFNSMMEGIIKTVNNSLDAEIRLK
jgi:cell fate (sporulation/competence/biofilm development) regulator YlbF (YheA/YmcA/DUF963 family)